MARAPSLNNARHLTVWLNLYNKANALEVQLLRYNEVRRLVAAPSEPLEHGQPLKGIKPKQPLGMRQLMGSLTDLCGDAAIANESVRVLFSQEGRALKPVLYLATKLFPLGSSPATGAVPLGAAGALTMCMFDEEDALGTKGVRRVMARIAPHLDLDECMLIDIVCSQKHTRSGRSLLGTALVELKRLPRTRQKQGVLSIAVSKEGRHILKSFGFHEVKHKGNWLMYMDLETVSFERFTSALQFSNSDTYLNEVCWRRGLTSPTQNKTFANGCL